MLRHRATLRWVLACIFAIGVTMTTAAVAEDGQHLVPADKGLSPDYFRSLTERGRQAVWTGDDLETIGMPVSGIATGQMYLRGDGTLAAWQIFNKHINTGYGSECYKTYRPESPVDSGFALVFESDGKTVGKALDRDFGRVAFAGEYPIGLVSYRAGDCPIDVEMEAFSPFIPLNAKDSALPATVFHITLKNKTDKPQNVALLGWLENAVSIDSAELSPDLRRTQVVTEKGRTSILHTALEAPKKQVVAPRPAIVLADFEGPDYGDWKTTGEAFSKAPAKGTLTGQQAVRGFQGDGLVNTFLGGDGPHGTLTSPPFEITRKFINFMIGGGNHRGQTCITLRVNGKIERTAEGRNNERLQWAYWNVENLQGKTGQIEIIDRHSGAWGHINIDQIELADVPKTGVLPPLKERPDFGSLALTSMAKTQSQAKTGAMLSAVGTPWAKKLNVKPDVKFPDDESLTTAIATETTELAPGAERTLTFVVSWFFPNHDDGHEYANRFGSATDVAHYVLDENDRLTGDTRLWHKTFYEDSTMPRWLLFRLHSTVSNLATGTCQWWKNGRFWAWEGVGCCAGTCTHVWNYAHACARLFPALERSARTMQDFGQGFDPETGLVGFRSNRAYAADGQCGTILKAYREHLCSPDMSFLKHNWPRIKKALEYSISRDENADGLIEDSQHNTFDINFEGPNTFVGSLYLAALRAGEEMAKDMGDEAFAKRCRDIFESGQKLTLQRLWDGEYFNQITDVEKYDWQYGKGCLSDQLFGQGWAHQLGLGYIYPRKNVVSALGAIWKYNWAPDIAPYNAVYKPGRWFVSAGEAGLFTCTWPKSDYLPRGVRYKNEVWTGIEYQVAGNMAADGMVKEALAICRAIEDRYHPAKHNPYNEVECGDHYARALASWGVYTALCGFEYNGPKGHIGFHPKLQNRDFKAAFTAAEGWGLYSQSRARGLLRSDIELRWGTLTLKTIRLMASQRWTPETAKVTLGGQSIGSRFKTSDGYVTITLDEPLVLTEGQDLQIEISL